MAAGVQLSAKYTLIGGPREGRTFSSAAGYSGDDPGYYWTGLAAPNDVGQDGTRAVLNDPTDPDYIGNVSDVTGLDGAEIRESSDDNVQEDGAIHGEFYQGRRPITLTAQIGGNTTPTIRNLRQQRWTAAVRALRNAGVANRPGVLRWQPDGFPEMFARYRAQQPARTTGAWLKDSAVSLVAADPRIYGVERESAFIVPSGSASAGRTYDRSYDVNYDWAPNRGTSIIVNDGDADTPLILTLTGPMDAVAIQNVTTGEEIALNGSLSSTDTLVIDTKRKTITLNGTINAFDRLELPRSKWIGLAPGTNDIRLLANSFTSFASPAGMSGLQAWYKADALALSDNDPVGSWTDSSGNARHAIQATAGKKPLYKTNIFNGQPVVRFDGSDDFLKALFTLNQPAEILVVSKYRSSSYTPLIMGGTVSSQIFWGVPTNDVRLYAGTAEADAVPFDPSLAPNLLDGLFSGAASELRANGGAPGTGNPGTAIFGGLTLANNFAEGEPSPVDIAEVLAFNRALTSDERNNIGGYVQNKYAIAISGASFGAQLALDWKDAWA